jgi:hypothetical protein
MRSSPQVKAVLNGVDAFVPAAVAAHDAAQSRQVLARVGRRVEPVEFCEVMAQLIV